MPTAMTYTSLLVDLRRYLERGQVTDTTVFDQLPRLINNAEREIAQDLKILGFKMPYNTDLVSGQSVYVKPDRWRLTESMWFGHGVTQLVVGQVRAPLFARSYEYCRSFWPDASVLGIPKFYADYNYSNWLIVPTPIVAYSWEAVVYEMLPLLDDVNQTNWLTDYAPTTLLYRALLECEPFLKEDERIPVWKGMYVESSSKLTGQDLQRIIDNQTSRERA